MPFSVFRLANFGQPADLIGSSASQRPRITRNISDYSLHLGGLSEFFELPFDPIEGQQEEAFWIAVSGYFLRDCAKTETLNHESNRVDQHARYIASMLVEQPDIERLTRLQGSYCILLAAPWRNWCAIIRDEVGGRSAFYASLGNRLAISDRPSAIASLSQFGLTENPEFVSSLFAFRLGRPLGISAFQDVKEVLPGERIEFCIQHAKSYRAGFEFDSRPKRGSIDQWSERLENSLNSSIEAALQDEPMPAIMLSGGMDSAPIAAIADSILKNSDRRLRAISWELEQYSFSDEARYVEEISSFVDLDQYIFDGSARIPYKPLDQSQVQLDAPYLNPFWTVIKPLYLYAQAYGHGVILHGGAGDVLYPHRSWAGADMLRRLEILQLVRHLREEMSGRGISRAFKSPSIRFMARKILIGLEPVSPPAPAWLPAEGEKALAKLRVLPEVRKHWCPMHASRLIGNLMSVGCAYENMVTEEYGISRRDPFADREVVRTFLEMPFSMSHRNGQTKWIMRELSRTRNLLPDSISKKGRTGILNEFLAAGFYSNLGEIRQLLMDCPEWRPWLKEEVVLRSFERETASAFDRALAGIAIGYVLWRQRLNDVKMSK